MCALEARSTKPAPVIETGRLILRAPSLADAPLIAELANDADVARMLAMLPHPYALGDAETWLSSLAAPTRGRDAVFAIEHRDFGLMGVIGLEDRDPKGSEIGRRPELGYWLGRPFWGRGYATEAARAVLDWARGTLRLGAVWAGHFADNPASGQVLIKAGFLYTGEVVPTASLGRDGALVPSRRMVWLA